MRYFILFIVMFTDILILLSCISVIYYLGWMGIIIAILVIAGWYNDGRFEAWEPNKIKTFLKNAKELGI